MKKLLTFIFAFVLCIGGGLALAPSSLLSLAEEPSYQEVYINSAQQFISTFNSSTTYDNENIKIILNRDINLNNSDLSQIYQTRRVFQGVLDGNGFTISNFTLTSEMYYYGLIPYASGATIQNLRITGDITITLDETNSNPLYIGLLVGYGENVTISNCELYNVEVTTDINGDQSNVYNQVALPVYSNITFGGLIGRATSFTSLGETNNRSIIENCVNYYDIKIAFYSNSRVVVGGLVGSLSNGSMILDCLNFGDITVDNTNLPQSDTYNSQYYGGICGEMSGTSTSIINTAYGGSLTNQNGITNSYIGAIVGYLNCPQIATHYNVNFSYWSQPVINYYGTGYSISNNNLRQVSTINRDFLSDESNFDTRELGFDFDLHWTMVNSEILLQNFQSYSITFNNNLDVGEIIDSATIKLENQQGAQSSLTAKYGNYVVMELDFVDVYNGYYSLSSVLLNGNVLSGDYYSALPITNTSGAITGYTISMMTSDMTDGSYSFTLSAIPYNCVVEISQQAMDNSQGGVRVVGASSTTSSLNLTFSDTNRSMDVQAVGNGIYTFLNWSLLYRDDNGDFTVEGTLSDNINQNAIISIDYGTAPFNREFKLVANFTDEQAILISFDGYNQDQISSITLSGLTYQGESIAVASTSTSTILEVITNQGYELDVDAFVSYISRLYGVNSTSMLIMSEPTTNENGQTTYQFRLNMTYIINGINDRNLTINLSIDDSNMGGGSLLWLYILLPIVVLAGVGIALFFILRNRRGGSGRGKSSKTDKKEDSYLDYYV